MLVHKNFDKPDPALPALSWVDLLGPAVFCCQAMAGLAEGKSASIRTGIMDQTQPHQQFKPRGHSVSS